MLPYYKNYTIIACIVAVAVPVIVTTVWPMVTGKLIFSSFGGLILTLTMLFATMMIMVQIMNRKAQQKTDELVGLYNAACDPDAFVSQGARLAQATRERPSSAASWYLTYYAQALLDVGKPEEAEAIYREEVGAARQIPKPLEKAAMLANMIPLAMKLLPMQDCIALADESIAALQVNPQKTLHDRVAFVRSQRQLCEMRMNGSYEELIKQYEPIRTSDTVPMRIRVETAWHEAQAAYHLGNHTLEHTCIAFVADNGGKLALAKTARERVASENN